MRPQVHPSYFGSPETPLFGHLHLPTDGVCSGPSVVLCPAFGHEYMSAHRSYRDLADQLAAAGMACLRFDYPGCGDSADLDEGAPVQGIATWPGAIGQAIDHLKSLTGADQVALVGLRLGASLAVVAAQTRQDVGALVAIAPVLKGRAFARECKALGMATLARTGLIPTAPADTIEAGGYRLSAADTAWLGSLDLLNQPARPATTVLLIERDDLPPEATWAPRLTEQGALVERCQLPGYDAMMQVPHLSSVPEAMLARTVSWLQARIGSARLVPVDVQRLQHTAVLPRLGVQDQAVWLPAPSPLAAVVTTPLHSSHAPKAAVLMINTGAEHRIGTNRMYTPWARRWAARGWVAMRVDLAGLGNSAKRAGCADNDIHLPHAVADIQTAVAHLREHHGIHEVHLIGLCSGAFHALSAAFEGTDLRSVTAINQMVYFWQDKMPLVGEASAAVVVHITQGVGRSLTDPARWLKLLRGQVNVSLILRAIGRRLTQRLSLVGRQLARVVGWPLKNDLHHALRQTVARGLAVHLVFAKGEPGLTMLQEQAGGAVARLSSQQALKLTVMEQADHTFTQSEAQRRLFDIVDQRIQQVMSAPGAHTVPGLATGVFQETTS